MYLLQDYYGVWEYTNIAPLYVYYYFSMSHLSCEHNDWFHKGNPYLNVHPTFKSAYSNC